MILEPVILNVVNTIFTLMFSTLRMDLLHLI